MAPEISQSIEQNQEKPYLAVRAHHLQHWVDVADLWYNSDFGYESNTISSRRAPGEYSRTEFSRVLHAFSAQFAEFQRELHVGRQVYNRTCIRDYSQLADELAHLESDPQAIELPAIMGALSEIFQALQFEEIFDTDEKAQALDIEADQIREAIDSISQPEDITALTNRFTERSKSTSIPCTVIEKNFITLCQKNTLDTVKTTLRAVVSIALSRPRAYFRLGRPAELLSEVQQEVLRAQKEYDYEVDLVGDVDENPQLSEAYRNRVFLTTYKFFAAAHAAPEMPVVISTENDDICASCRGGEDRYGKHCDEGRDNPKAIGDAYFLERLRVFAQSENAPQELKEKLTTEEGTVSLPVGLLFDKAFLQAFFDTTYSRYQFI